MVGTVVITHGQLAESLVAVAESIVGKAEGVKTVSVNGPDTTESIRKRLAESIREADAGMGVVVFTDMFGGTPTNVALSFLSEGAVEVVTGVNLPILIKHLGHRADKTLQELAAMLKDYGRTTIVLAGEMLKEKK